MPTIAIQPANAPIDAPFPPASAQALLNFVAAYLQVSGLESINGIVVGTATPAADDRNKGWIKIDPATNRALGLYVFNGTWVPLPLVIPNGSAPASPRTGELHLNEKGGVQIYDGSKWTTNLIQSGSTADRPSNAEINDLYFDTEIGRLLRRVTQGWTTLEGAVGDVKMVDFADSDAALAANPGWSVYGSMKGRFPYGANDTVTPQSEGGTTLDQLKVTWSSYGTSAQGGSRDANLLSNIKLNGIEGGPKSKMNSETAVVTDQAINLTPPYKALIFLRKDY